MASDYNSSDLTSILNTLSALSNPAARTQNHHHGQHTIPQSQSQSQIQEPEDDAYEPSDTIPVPVPAPPITSSQPQPHIHTPKPPQPQPQPQPTPTPQTDLPNPSTITTWPPALRHIMRTVAQSEDLQRRIRRLLQSQHDHEKQWWQGREALCKKQMARVEKKKELDEVLRSVGAPVDSTKGVSTAEEDKAELNTYDSKIYSASTQMAQALTLELRGLGIPFFSIQRYLVVDKNDNKHTNTDTGTDRDVKQQQKLPRDQLANLQRRMLELLLDLCKE